MDKKANKIDITDRTFKFSIQVVKLLIYLRKNNKNIWEIANQFLSSGTSIGANIEEAQSASSRKDFINKMTIALREARETRYWLRLFYASKICSVKLLEPLMKENLEIIKILVSIIKNSKINNYEL